jgi:hypothetical protein
MSMAHGRRAVKLSEMLVAVIELPKSPAEPFYSRLNRLLAEALSAFLSPASGSALV